jgi:DNA-binding transcriptional LysR family regulator
MMTMQDVHIDLNLLRAFDALLAERNVTRAARRLGIGQPALSHALGRLRDVLGDPLLVRTPKGMVPTARALALEPIVRSSLADLDRAIFTPPAFAPQASRATFVVAASDYALFLLLPKMAELLQHEAPNVTLDVRPIVTWPPRFDDGELDLALGPAAFTESSDGLFRQRLFDERFVCLVRKGHPLAKGKVTVERFLAFPHALIAPRGSSYKGIVDDELAKIGRKRRVAMTIPHFLVAPYVIRSTDLVLTLAERVARAMSEGLAIFEPPLRIPGFTIHQIWHARRGSDAAHQWFRGLVMRAAEMTLRARESKIRSA